LHSLGIERRLAKHAPRPAAVFMDWRLQSQLGELGIGETAVAGGH
jgi:hypothetical protein